MKYFAIGFLLLTLSIYGLLSACSKERPQKQIQDPINVNITSTQKEQEVLVPIEELVVEEKPKPTPEEIPPKIIRQTVLDGRVTLYEVCVNGVMYYITGQGSLSPAYHYSYNGSMYTCDADEE